MSFTKINNIRKWEPANCHWKLFPLQVKLTYFNLFQSPICWETRWLVFTSKMSTHLGCLLGSNFFGKNAGHPPASFPGGNWQPSLSVYKYCIRNFIISFNLVISNIVIFNTFLRTARRIWKARRVWSQTLSNES